MSFEEHLREKHTEATSEANGLFQQELNTRRQGRHWSLSNASSALLVGGIQMSWGHSSQRDSRGHLQLCHLSLIVEAYFVDGFQKRINTIFLPQFNPTGD